VWFDILNSQSGTTSKHLIGSSFQFGVLSCIICVAKAHPSTPLCQCCWRWGHLTKACRLQAPHCPQCSGLHTEANHRQLASCCQVTPWPNHPSQLHQRELHALMPHAVLTVKRHTVHLTNDALSGSIGLTRLGFPHRLPCPTSGRRLNQRFQWPRGNPSTRVRRREGETQNCDPQCRCDCQLSLALALASL
jgi:hypothetical protein